VGSPVSSHHEEFTITDMGITSSLLTKSIIELTNYVNKLKKNILKGKETEK